MVPGIYYQLLTVFVPCGAACTSIYALMTRVVLSRICSDARSRPAVCSSARRNGRLCEASVAVFQPVVATPASQSPVDGCNTPRYIEAHEKAWPQRRLPEPRRHQRLYSLHPGSAIAACRSHRVRVGRERKGTPFPFFFIERERRSVVFFLYSPIVNCNFPWKSFGYKADSLASCVHACMSTTSIV